MYASDHQHIKAKMIPGTKYMHAHTSCPSGWGFDPKYTVKIGRLAIETGLYVLYEIEYSKWRLTGPSEKLLNKKLRPVRDYFEAQTRFKSITSSLISQVQKQVDEKWAGFAS